MKKASFLPFEYFSQIILLTIFSFFFTFNSFSQTTDKECGTVLSEAGLARAIAQVPKVKEFVDNHVYTDTTFVPVYFTVARYEDGSHPYPTPVEDYLQEALDTLNVHFSPINLFFVQCGNVHYIDRNEVMDTVNLANNFSYISSALNIYISSDVIHDVSFSNFPPSIDFSTAVDTFNNIIRWNILHDNAIKVLIHEIGHSYGLLHTFQQSAGVYNNPANPLINFLPNGIFLDHPYDTSTTAIMHRELVIRQEDGLKYFSVPNHFYAGDLVSDTHAACNPIGNVIQYPSGLSRLDFRVD